MPATLVLLKIHKVKYISKENGSKHTHTALTEVENQCPGVRLRNMK